MSNHISASLSSTDLDAILAAFKTIREKMPFLKALSATEKEGMPRASQKSMGFIQSALKLAQHNNEFLPSKFDIKEMAKDVELMNQLEIVRIAMTKLQEELDDTLIAAKTDAYSAALVVYQFAKNSQVGTAGLDELVDELGKRFSHKSKSTKPPAA